MVQNGTIVETVDSFERNADVHVSQRNENTNSPIVIKESVNIHHESATELISQDNENTDSSTVKNAAIKVTPDTSYSNRTFHTIVGKNTLINTTLDHLNRNTHEHGIQERNFDTFTLNNVGRTRLPLSTTRMDSPYKVELNKHIQYTDRNLPALHISENNRRSFENTEEGTTVKPILPEKIKPLDNPNLADFHVIDTEKDLEVPSGVEGPIPSVVLPPKGFVSAQREMARKMHTVHTSRGSYLFFEPGQYQRRYFVPRTGTSLADWNHYKLKKNRR